MIRNENKAINISQKQKNFLYLRNYILNEKKIIEGNWLEIQLNFSAPLSWYYINTFTVVSFILKHNVLPFCCIKMNSKVVSKKLYTVQILKIRYLCVRKYILHLFSFVIFTFSLYYLQEMNQMKTKIRKSIANFRRINVKALLFLCILNCTLEYLLSNWQFKISNTLSNTQQLFTMIISSIS